MSLAEKLKEHLENGKDWEKLKTPVEGVFVVKMPAKGRFKAKLAVEINPGNKRKGLYITSFDQFQAFMEVFSNQKMSELVKSMDEVNGVEGKAEEGDIVGELEF